jgi:Tfp pilus assembly protein PilN
MTTAVKEKKPFLPQRRPSVSTTIAVPGSNAPAARSTLPAVALSIGGEPRVHLLPPDVIARKKLKAIKRRLWMAVIVVVAISAIAYGGTVVSLTAAQAQLQSANSAATLLTVQQAKYGEVSKVKADINSIQQAQKTATAKEILWAPYIGQIQASLPAGATIQSMNAGLDLASASTAAPTTVPLQATHIATLTVTVGMNQADIAGWVGGLTSIKGFVDAVPDSVSVNPKGGYLVEVTILMNSSSLSNRFAKAVK